MRPREDHRLIHEMRNGGRDAEKLLRSGKVEVEQEDVHGQNGDGGVLG
jgi:hypothetical protein